MAALNALRRKEGEEGDEHAAASKQDPEAKPAVALIMACGQIVSGKGSATDLAPMREIASTPMCAQLRAARFDPQVKAVVLRVDTPGKSQDPDSSIAFCLCFILCRNCLPSGPLACQPQTLNQCKTALQAGQLSPRTRSTGRCCA